MRVLRLPFACALMASLLLTGACSASDVAPPPSSTPSPSATAEGEQPISGSGGDAVGSSDPVAVQDCGGEEQLHGTNFNRAARQCLWDGYASGEGGQFLSTIVTVEGDPVLRHITVFSQNRIVVMVDNTEDQFSAPDDRRVVNYECTGMAVTEDGQNDLAFEITVAPGMTGTTSAGESMVI